MKLYWRESVYGWVMTGLVGKEARWFLGFSRVPQADACPNALMGEHRCANRHQCWEPCGELGNSEEHVRGGIESPHIVAGAVPGVPLADIARAISPPVTLAWVSPVDIDGYAVTPKRLIAWLDAKYSRHGEEEDKWAADYIRAATSTGGTDRG